MGERAARRGRVISPAGILPGEMTGVSSTASAAPARPAAPETAAGSRPFHVSSLFWRVFLVNGVLLAAAAFALAVSPATVSFPATARQLTVLAVGVVFVLLANAALLRRSLRPLRELEREMSRIDLLVPADRLEPIGAAELQSVTAAFNRMLERLEQERRTSSSRVADRQEEERRRLASELHDEVGQRLTALLLQLRAVIEEAPPELVPQLHAAQELARANLEEIGRLARQLRPTALDDLGLAYALHSLLDVAEANGGVRLVREIDAELPQLERQAELAVYRIAQEAVTNVLRHSGASTLSVRASASPSELVLEVADDGRGMLYAADQESGGIRGMLERTLAVNGLLHIRSRPGGGTTVAVRVPRPL
jgi:two-component system, NarL family, sensor histidine kinase UhpB